MKYKYKAGDTTRELSLTCLEIEKWLVEQSEYEVWDQKERDGYFKTLRYLRSQKRKFRTKIRSGLI